MQLEPVVQPTDGGPFLALAGAADRTSEPAAIIAADNAVIARYFIIRSRGGSGLALLGLRVVDGRKARDHLPLPGRVLAELIGNAYVVRVRRRRVRDDLPRRDVGVG